MKKIIILSALAMLPFRVNGQELYVAPIGRMETPYMNQTSFAWEYGYRQYIYPNIAVSTSWLNEGHVYDHHRDGSAWELWGYWLPFGKDNFSLSAGVGAYYFFDTEYAHPLTGGTASSPPPPGGSIDVHGTAVIVSAAATWYPTDSPGWERLFFRLTASQEDPSSDIRINAVDLAAGVWLGPLPKYQTKFSDPALDEQKTGFELTGFGGFSVENAFSGQHRYAYAGEFRAGILTYLDGTLSYFDETDLKITQRTGIGTQLWARYPFWRNRVSVGVGAGIYTAVGPRNAFAPGQYFTPIVAPFFSQTVAIKLTKKGDVDLRVTWNRVTGYDNPDADVVLFGLGYVWK
jgi:hypothetical protein